MNPVVHFEMPAEDTERVKKFYGEVFGWNLTQLGEDMGNYILAATGENDPKTTFPTEPGRINGGIYKKGDTEDKQRISLVLSVDNVDEYTTKITEAGGKVLEGPYDIPGVGRFIGFKDTEGNVMGALQPGPMQG